MAVPAPTNCWTAAESTFAQAIAASAAFQAMCGVGSESEAAAFVFGEQLDEPLNGDHYTREEETEHHKHIAQVYSAADSPYGKRRLSSRHHYPFGTAVWYFERLVTELEANSAEVPQEIERRWKNTVGDILDDVLTWLETNGGPHVSQLEVEEHGMNPRERWASEGVWQGASVLVTWGIEE